MFYLRVNKNLGYTKNGVRKNTIYMILKKRGTFTGVIQIVFLLLLFVVYGCKSYDVVKNGFIVQGDNNFYNIDEKLIISMGPDLLSDSLWRKENAPIITSSPSHRQDRLLRKIGYNKRDYAIVFTSGQHLPFQITTLLNKFSLTSKEKPALIDKITFNKIESSRAKWYEKIEHLKGKEIYHAIIPISEKLFDEKYLSLVYTGPMDEQNLKIIKNIVQINAINYRMAGLQFLPIKTVETSHHEDDATYFDYTVPDVIQQRNQYAIIKILNKAGERELVYYSLFKPGQSLGAFKIYKGNYTMQYTSLQGNILWEQELNIN